VEPELTDLFLAAVQGLEHSIFLLRVDMPLEHGVPEVAAALRSLGVPLRRRRSVVVRFEENTLPVLVLGVQCVPFL
jgi:hypothetical protein